MSRVVITGLGPVSSVGIGIGAFKDALRSGRSGVSRVSSFDVAGFPHIYAGEVRRFDPERILTRLAASEWGLSTLFAASAARLAANDAQLDAADVPPERMAVAIGTTCGESRVVEQLTEQVLEAGFDAWNDRLVAQLPAERLAHGVSEEIGAAGESITISTACAASNYAIGYGYDRVSQGDYDVMIVGGADSVCRWVHAGFLRLGTLAADSCRPFDRERTGIITAEGGSALVLENLEHARDRGVRIYAEVLGYGLNCDADHVVAPNSERIAACMRHAHEHARVRACDIDYICAHGTGTPANDLAEFRAIRQVFGAALPPVSSIKSMLGHTMGAASGFGAIAAALAIQSGFLPPTINWSCADPEMEGLDPVPNHSRVAPVRVVQNNGFAFGGNNAITIFGAYA